MKEAGEILLKQPGMEELDAILRQRGLKPASFDDWRNESSSHNVAVVYRGDVGKVWVKLHAQPVFDGYATWGGEMAAAEGDNWLLGIGGADLKWGRGAETLSATLDDLFENEQLSGERSRPR